MGSASDGLRLLSRACGAVLAGGLAVAVLVAATPSPASVLRAVDDPAGAVAVVGVEGAVVQVLVGTAWLCLAWLLAGAVAAALAHVPGVVGRAAGRVASAVTPSLVRRAVEALLGLGALAGVVAPAAASAAPPAATALAAEARVATASATPAPSLTASTVLDPSAAASVQPLAAAVPSVDWPGRAPRPVPHLDWPAEPATDRPGTAPSATPARPSAAGARPVVAPTAREASGEALVVRRGDTLWSIAARHLGPDATPTEVARAWPAWHEANRAVIGSDPHRLLPGQRLLPPA